MSITITREMTITHADFFRLLPRALRHDDYRVRQDKITVNIGDSALRIRLSEESRRNLGAFSLPVTHVEMEFKGMDEEAVREFLKIFDRAYQKGGG